MKKQKILTGRQVAILKEFGNCKFIVDNFYLSGGTALAGFYLQHRYSEDLDFFAEEIFDLMPINIFLKQIKKDLKIKKIDFEQSYNRNLYFLHLKEEILKIEFTYYPFKRIEKGMTEFQLKIDSIYDIAVNKLFSIYQRCVARDYIDLYCICKEMNYKMIDLIKTAKIKFDWHIDPIQLGAQFYKAKVALDYPRMIKKIDNKAWRNFFIKEAKKFDGNIFRN